MGTTGNYQSTGRRLNRGQAIYGRMGLVQVNKKLKTMPFEVREKEKVTEKGHPWPSSLVLAQMEGGISFFIEEGVDQSARDGMGLDLEKKKN